MIDFGWPPPPVLTTNPPPRDRYHVRIEDGGVSYMTSVGAHSGLVGDNPASLWDDGDAQASCVVVDSRLAWGRPTPLDYLRILTAHEFTQFSFGVEDHYALNWIGLPVAVGAHSVRLENRSTSGGVLRMSAVCDTGNGFLISELATVLGAGEVGVIPSVDSSTCVEVVAVITNEDQPSSDPSSCTEAPYELSLDVPSGEILLYAVKDSPGSALHVDLRWSGGIPDYTISSGLDITALSGLATVSTSDYRDLDAVPGAPGDLVFYSID